MIKRDEIEHPESCFNKATDSERLFVLLSRDPAAPIAIRAWIDERIRLGKNKPDDAQIREARECAARMEIERAEIESARAQQALRWSEGSFEISKLASPIDMKPSRVTMTWSDFVTRFSAPIASPCTLASCAGTSCTHKRGPCWTPAVYEGAAAIGRGNVEGISMLVFDVERAPDDQIYAIRRVIGGYRHLIHATHSDRPGNRFVRVIITLSRPVRRDVWSMFWRTAQQMLVPIADSACSDAGRVYFLPSVPSDAGYFVQVNEGEPLDVDAVMAAAAVPQADHAAAVEAAS